MDELKMKLHTKFMKRIVAKAIEKALHRKFGYDVDIQLSDVELSMDEGKINLHIAADASMSQLEMKRILESVGLD